MAEQSDSDVPSVCVVITAYRQPGLLPEAVLSALHQRPACHILLVNDGCPYAETHEFCIRIRAAHPDRIRYIRQKNRGPGAARNAAIELALCVWPDFDAMFFLDGDNRLGSSTIRQMHHSLRRHDADWVFSDMHLIGRNGLVGMAGEYCVLEHMLRNYVDTGSLLSRRVLDAGVRFDSQFTLGFEDWDFWLGAARRGFRGVYAASCGFLYRRRPESMIRNSNRDRDEIVGHLRRKHRGLINPRTCVRIEHKEAPRYALFLPDSDHVSLFTDPEDRARRMPAGEFLGRLAQAMASQRLCRMPAYLVAASGETIEWFQKKGLLHGVLWHLETAASHCGLPVMLTPDDAGGYAIRKAGNCSEPSLIALGGTEFSRSRSPISAAQFGGVNLSALKQRATATDLIALLEKIRAFATDGQSNEGFLLCSGNRRKEVVSNGIRSLFRAGPLFPLAGERRRVGFLLKGEMDDRHRTHITPQLEAARALSWSTHLFWIRQTNTQRLPTDWRFDTVTQLSIEQLRKVELEGIAPEFLGLLSTQDAIVNHECPEWLPLSGELRRLGVKTLYSSCTGAGVDVAVQFEYAVSAYLFDSGSFYRRLRAFGIPASKLQTNLRDCLCVSEETVD